MNGDDYDDYKADDGNNCVALHCCKCILSGQGCRQGPSPAVGAGQEGEQVEGGGL